MGYLIANHGSVNIGDVGRASMRCILKDEVLLHFNRTGRDGKQELPKLSFDVFYVRLFFRNSKKECKTLFSKCEEGIEREDYFLQYFL